MGNYISDDELKKNNPELYRVARENATEAPGAGAYTHTTDNGVYHCAVCHAVLFSSGTKFESGSGWPAFTDPANREAVTLTEDASHGMSRVEVRCKKCGAHLGHVFPDGPMKDGKTCDRYCINSVSLSLEPEQQK